VRELQNELQRYLVEQRLEFLGDVSTESPAQGVFPDINFDPKKMRFNEAVAAFEKHLIAEALAQNAWHQGKTAQVMGIPPRTLYTKIKKYDLKNSRN
jgi:DNA-binding NtrC family response regulator